MFVLLLRFWVRSILYPGLLFAYGVFSAQFTDRISLRVQASPKDAVARQYEGMGMMGTAFHLED